MGNTIQQWRASIGGLTRGYLFTASAKNRESSVSEWFQVLVLLVILVIGGIELNPGPNQVSITSYSVNGFILSMLK